MTERRDDMAEPDNQRDEQPVIIRRGGGGYRPPLMMWVMFGLIALFFALGILLVTTGLTVPDGDPLPGPTAFTLTPQITETSTPAP